MRSKANLRLSVLHVNAGNSYDEMLTEIIVNIKGISFFSNFELVLKILLWYSCIYTLRDHCPHSMHWYKILRTVTNPHGRVSFIGCGSMNNIFKT